MKQVLILLALFILFLLGFVVFRSGKSPAVKAAEARIGSAVFRVDVADTFASRAQGLSGRLGLAGDQGMLFVFPVAGLYGFWMKDMNFPLDIIWIRGGRVIGFAENVPPPSGAVSPIVKPPGPVDRVLEINAGLVKRYGLRVGDSVVVKLQ